MSRQPPNTKSKTIYLPVELHAKLTRVAGYGKVEQLIIECLEEAIAPRYKKWKDDLDREPSGRKTVRGVR
jgi:hypothetical protein